MAKGLPVEVHLCRVSSHNNAHAIMFNLLDDFWQIERASILANVVVLTRYDSYRAKKIVEDPTCLIPVVPNKYGVNTNGYAYPIKKAFTKANLMRYIRQDPNRHLLGLRKKLQIRAISSGIMIIQAGTKEAIVSFSDHKPTPIWISRAIIRRRRRKLSEHQGGKFLLDVYGTLLRSLDDVIERVMQDTTIFVDPLEMKTVNHRQTISLRLNKITL